MVTLRLIELRSIITLADWLWLSANPEPITQRFCLFVCVWLRMRTIASVSQSAWTIIICRYCCGKQCELLLNRFLIKDLHHKFTLLCHLPLSSVIDDKIRLPPLFQPCVEIVFRPPPLLSTPTYKKSRPPLHFDNSITGKGPG